MKKSAQLADSKSVIFLEKLSKQALIDLVFDLAMMLHGEEVEFRERAEEILKEHARPVLAARGDRFPK